VVRPDVVADSKPAAEYAATFHRVASVPEVIEIAPGWADAKKTSDT
jgi:hypothetical protein